MTYLINENTRASLTISLSFVYKLVKINQLMYIYVNLPIFVLMIMGYKKGQYLHEPKFYLPTREVNNSINCTNILYHIGME